MTKPNFYVMQIEEPVVCVHHNDADGCCAAAIVGLTYQNIEFIGMKYGDEIPWERLQYKHVIMVDFSLQPWCEMEKLHSSSKLVWIDHHVTAIEDFTKSGISIPGMRSTDFSACELTWTYLLPNIEMPRAVHLVGRYDVWDHAHEDVIFFQSGHAIVDINPSTSYWKSLFESDEAISKVIETGKIVRAYEKVRAARDVKYGAFLLEFEGLRCLTMNHTMFSSALFDSIWDSSKYDLMAIFVWEGDKWRVSLRSTETDVGEIAKKYGGGGHKKSAGFTTNRLPFKLSQAVLI